MPVELSLIRSQIELILQQFDYRRFIQEHTGFVEIRPWSWTVEDSVVVSEFRISHQQIAQSMGRELSYSLRRILEQEYLELVEEVFGLRERWMVPAILHLSEPAIQVHESLESHEIIMTLRHQYRIKTGLGAQIAARKLISTEPKPPKPPKPEPKMQDGIRARMRKMNGQDERPVPIEDEEPPDHFWRMK